VAPTINTDGISDQEKAAAKFQIVYQGMMAQLSRPGFIPILCAHEAAHLVYFTMAGLKEYDPHPASIRYDPTIDDYVGDLAGVKLLDLPPWVEGKFWEWFGLVAKAHAAGGVVARKLDPSTDGGDKDDRSRFKDLCDHLNGETPKLLISFEEVWKRAQESVLEDLSRPEMMQIIEEHALVLKREFGL
jgi:hypothetical protein